MKPATSATFLLGITVTAPRVDLVARRTARAVWTCADGEHRTAAEIFSPGLLAPELRRPMLVTTTPTASGTCRVHLLEPETGEIEVTLDPEVLSTGERTMGTGTLSITEPGGPVARGRRLKLGLTITNQSDVLWRAMPSADVPKESGAVVLDAVWLAPGEGTRVRPIATQVNGPFAYRPLFLPRDLGPGESESAVVYVDAPPRPGTYLLQLSARGVGPGVGGHAVGELRLEVD